MDGWLLVMRTKKEGKIVCEWLLMIRKTEINNYTYDINVNSGQQFTSSDDATPRGPSLHHGEGLRWVGRREFNRSYLD